MPLQKGDGTDCVGRREEAQTVFVSCRGWEARLFCSGLGCALGKCFSVSEQELLGEKEETGTATGTRLGGPPATPLPSTSPKEDHP